jgi:hypothetical protein
VLSIVASFLTATQLRADIISFTGTITQSVQDGTGPASNNPALNRIPDGADVVVTWTFPGAITSPGSYLLPGSSLLFDVPSANAMESHFASQSLTVAQAGALDLFSLLGCLSTGSACDQGNELTLNFVVASTLINSTQAPALSIGGIVPLDLLEDDGATEIQASLQTYSYTSAAVPEPAAFYLLGSVIFSIVLARIRKRATA